MSDQTDASSANININLNAPNTPPPTQPPEGAVGGTGPGTASGAISLTDPENDAVSISEVLVNGTAYSAGPGGVYTIAGLYGTFVLRPDGTYDYTLTNQNATGVDVLEVVREDSFGATSTATVNIDVTPVPSGVSFLSRATDSGAEPFLLPEAQASSEGELGRSGSESERSGPFTQDALQQPSWLGDQSGKLDVSHLESILAAAEDLLITGSLPREVPSSLSAAKPFYTAPELGLMLEEQGEDLSDCLEGLRSFFGELKYGSDHALSAGLNLSEGITNEAALLFESGCALAGAEIEQWNPACMEDRTDAAMLEMIIRTESGG